MLRGILLLALLALSPLWASVLAERLGIPMFPTAVLSSWLRSPETGERPELPPPGWREMVYLARNPDVAAAVRDGAYASGYEHYRRYGRDEGRPGGPGTIPAPQPVQTAASPPASTPAPPGPAPSAPAVAALVPTPDLRPAAAVPATPAPVPLPPGPKPEAKPEPAGEREATAPSPVAVLPASLPLPGAMLPGRKPSPPAVLRMSPIRISAIRVAAHPTHTRIVLDSDSRLRVDQPARRGTRSISLDLPGTAWQPARQGDLGRSLTYRVESVGDASRLTLDAGKAIRVKSFFVLEPQADGQPYRLVLDLVRDGA